MGLKDSFTEAFKFGELKDQVVQLVEAKIELKKMEVQEKVENLFASIIYGLALIFISTIALVITSVWAAESINNWLSFPWGYIIVITFYLVLLIVLYLLKAKIAEKIREKIERSIDF